MPKPKLPPPHGGKQLPNEQLRLIQLRARPEIVNYFERMTLGHGWRQQVLDYMLEQFYAACQTAEIPTGWDLERESQIAEVLLRITFTPLPRRGTKQKPA